MEDDVEGRAWLEWLGADGQVIARADLGSRPCAIGSGPDSDLRVTLAGVSRLHATVARRERGLYWITDEHSSWGTLVDDEPIGAGGSRRLRHMSRISLGSPQAQVLFLASNATLPPEGVLANSPAPSPPALFLNEQRGQFLLHRRPLTINAMPQKLLVTLYLAKGWVASEDCIADLWDDERTSTDAGTLYARLQNTVSRLKGTLADAQAQTPPEQRVQIEGIRKLGYRLVVPGDPERQAQ